MASRTLRACFTGYVVQAIVNNFAPLLFLHFQGSYGIPLSQITMLITFNFCVQLLVDLLSAGFIDAIGYRAAAVLAHVLSAMGLLLLAFLPELLPDPFLGLLLAVTVYAVGGGLLEVLVSPLVEACPTKNKEASMSLLHSFYCWGHVGVVLLSTAFFALFGVGRWRVLAVLLALVPAVNGLQFLKVPIYALTDEKTPAMPVRELFSARSFKIFLLLMLCAGASEQAVSQWASAFAQSGLQVSKTVGDLAGPMAFALLMGTSRAIYGKFGDKLELPQVMGMSAALCAASYLLISLSPWPLLSLIGCGLCGLSVGILWPGAFSMASRALPRGGTALFALLALAGDLGCAAGPTLAGLVSSLSNGDLHLGILAAAVFPGLMVCGCAAVKRK